MDLKTVATKTIVLDATPAEVWRVVTVPQESEHAIFDYQALSNWSVGSEIIWTREHEVCDRGKIISIARESHLRYTSLDPRLGAEEIPENYLHISYDLEKVNSQTELTITIEGCEINPNLDFQIAKSWDKLFYLQLNLFRREGPASLKKKKQTGFLVLS